ncbi:hypothetical protein [Companilactobacillus kedongensis]|uniref:hypothetical protein n=1 Tax=Companilactobacillus kedongensis TaxID=2486004 RepID=UPI000F7796AE|nr:hypothetical protein [Companilactobacillus kedongensis]
MLFLFSLAITIISGVIVMMWFNARKQERNSFIGNKVAGISLLICIISFILLMTSTFSPGENTSSKDNVKVENKKKKKSPDKDQLNLTRSDVKKYNQSLIDGLNEDKSYASSGDDRYDYANYIDTLSYDSNRGLRISITPDFVNLNENEKNTIAGNAVGAAEAQLIIIGKNKDGTDKIHSNVYQGDTKLGSAKFSNNREFNWK